MHAAWEAFHDCGWAAWLCLLIGLLGTCVGVLGVALLATNRRSAAQAVGAFAIGVGILSFGAGVLGRVTGMRNVEAALSSGTIEPSLAAEIRAEGTHEAGQCVTVGAGCGALPVLLGALAAGIGLALQKEPPTSSS
jgi:hypothetical protein